MPWRLGVVVPDEGRIQAIGDNVGMRAEHCQYASDGGVLVGLHLHLRADGDLVGPLCSRLQRDVLDRVMFAGRAPELKCSSSAWLAVVVRGGAMATPGKLLVVIKPTPRPNRHN